MINTKINKIQFLCLVLVIYAMFGLISPAGVFASSQVRITEIMYDPSGDGSKEFIEFYNGSDTSVALGGWSTFGVDFVFPSGTSLGAGSYMVIARNLIALRASHPGANIIGQYGGKLKGTGELIRLNDSTGVSVSQVSYAFGGAWPSAPRNGGPSLSLIRPQANETLVACWGSSTVNGGSPGYSNSSSGASGSCSDVAYPFTPAPTPSPAAPNTISGSNGGTSTPNMPKKSSDPKKQIEEEKKQEAIKVAEEVARNQEAKSKQVIQEFARKKEQQKQQKWTIVYISMGVLVLGGIISWIFIRYKRAKDIEIVLTKGKKHNNGSKSKKSHN